MINKVVKMYMNIIIILFYSLNYAYAIDLESIYLVLPKDNEGGTFYCVEYNDNGNKKYKREGYIPTMTLIKVETDDKKKEIKKFITERKKNDQFLYAKFIGADGSDGWIRYGKAGKRWIHPLKEVFKARGQSLDKYNNYNLIIPISPEEEVIIYNWDQNNYNKIGKPHSFSRTTTDIVLTKEEVVFLLSEDGWEKTPYYKVKYFIEKTNQKYDEQTAILKVGEENITYRIFPLNPESYTAIKKKKGDGNGLFKKIKKLLNSFNVDADDNELKNALNKPCKQSVTISYKLTGTISTSWVPLIGMSAEGSLERKIEFPAGFRYTLDIYKGFPSNQEVKVLKILKCNEMTNTDLFVEDMQIIDIGKAKKKFGVSRDKYKKRFGDFFNEPDESALHVKCEKLFSLKTQTGGYFKVFSELDNYLDERLSYYYEELNAVERLKYKRFIIRLIVDCKR